MPTDSPSQGGRRHCHRGRRGHDRRGGERRTPQQQQQHQPAEQAPRGDQVDVEQIMRDIRAKIAQRHGIEFTDQQVQELAARRLDSILDPRLVKPALLDQLRRAAGARPDTAVAADRAEAPYTFEDTTLYESPSGFVRFLRKLFNPLLKLFFNPNPLIRALNVQARLNTEALKREAERDQRQAEWNALHYDILQRVVSEIAKVSLEAQGLALRVESLAAKVDFNERRVRGIEGTMHQARPSGARERERERDREPSPPPQQPVPVQPSPEVAETPAVIGGQEAGQGDAPRRRRRRRRGRRGGGAGEPATAGVADAVATQDAIEGDEADEREGDLPETVTAEPETFAEPGSIAEAKAETVVAPSPSEAHAEPRPNEPAESTPHPDPEESRVNRGPTEQ
jgi:hypothetical protein